MNTLTRKLRTHALVALAGGSLLLLGVGITPAAAAGTNTISGTVMAGGSPVSGANVTLWNNDTFATLGSVVADASGYFEFNAVPDGTWAGGANPNDPNSDFTFTDIAPFAVGPANTHQALSIDLPPWPTGTSSLSGVVVDAATQEPILDAHVSFDGMGGAKNRGVDVSAVDGSYLFDSLPAGAFSLGTSAPGYVYNYFLVGLDTADAQTVDIELLAANSAIQGTVSFAGAGVDGLDVFVVSGGSNSIPIGTTSGGGAFEFLSLGAGEYTVSVGGMGTPYKKQEKTVVAVANASVTVDFDLTERTIGTISGTIYDADGDPLEGICVATMISPTEWGPAFGGMGIGTDATGTYTIEDVDADTYRIVFFDECSSTRPHAEYAASYYGGTNGAASFTDGAPVVSNGDDITGYDIRMIQGGTIAGKVSLQTSTGVMDLPLSRGMDATVFQNTGGVWTPLPDLSSFVGGPGWGDYQVHGLYPGDYRVCFEDPLISGPRAFAFECWQDAATVATAASIAVPAGGVVANINAAVGIPRPGFNPVSVDTVDLDSADEGQISSSGSTTQGDSLDVLVGDDLAGEWVSVWGHSTPTLMGNWVQVSSTGHVMVPVPTSLPSGQHSLVAQRADGTVIGWSGLTVRARAGLASTGAAIAEWVIPTAALAVLGGLSLILLRRRRTAG